jgi:YfiH family protein
MKFTQWKNIPFFQFEHVSTDWPLRYAVSTRKGGVSSNSFDSLNVALHVGDAIENVIENRRRICNTINASIDRFISLKQAHSANVFHLKSLDNDSNSFGRWDKAKENVDAVVTNVQNVTLFVFAADCALTMFYDPIKNVLALSHSGWRGAVLNIYQNVIHVMQMEYGSNPGNIFAGIGPTICQSDFKIDEKAANNIKAIYPSIHQNFLSTHNNYCYMDIEALLRSQLEQLGVRNIEVANICPTENTDLFYSYEKEGKKTGRHGLFAYLI